MIPNHSLKRRASESEADQAFALIRQHNTRIPPPLPYLPSDYLPSPDSPRHIVLSTPVHANKRQRARSIGYPLVLSNNSASNKHFELVPYREWTVIARDSQRGQLVLYNQDNQAVTVQNYSTEHPFHTTEFQSEDVSHCPYCHRPMPDSPEPKVNEPDFMDRNYFRLLASSQANTAANSPVQSRSTTFSTDSEKPHPINGQNLNENAFNQGYYANFFVEVNKLGKGFRGSVFLCEHVLDGVKLGKYAVKKVAIGNNHPWLVRMLREVHLLERLRHPNIVSYKHSWLEYNRLTAFGPEVPCLFILMECANGGNLDEYLEAPTQQDHTKQKRKLSSKELKRERIRKQYEAQESFEKEQDVSQVQNNNKRLLTMTEILSLFIDIVQGLAHLHQQNIVHRDLKPPNFPRVLISDFGECEDLDDHYEDSNRTGATGTLEFMAPEHVRLDPRGRNTVDYSPKADMWSLGMVLYFLCYSRLPYNVIDDVDILRTEILQFREVWFPSSRLDIYKTDQARFQEASRDTSITRDIPNELKLLIRMLLSTDPAKRPSCNEILSKLRSFRRNDNIPFEWPSNPPSPPSSSPPLHKESPTNVLRQRLLHPTQNADGRDTVMMEQADDDSVHQLLLGSSQLNIRDHTQLLSERRTILMIKTATALLKVASCTYSCSPYSVKSSTLYPVLMLALLDFWSESSSPNLILLLLHVVWITTTTFVFATADFIAGNFGGMAQVIVGQPLDTIKVRLQLDQGIGAVNALLFAANSSIKSRLQKRPDELLSLDKIATAGAGAGLINSILASPVELLKIKMQAQFGSRAAHEGQRFFSGPFDCARYLIQRDGVAHGLFRGLWATVVREIPAYAGFYSGFEITKRYLTNNNQYEASVMQLMTSGAAGGVSYWICCYPLDVVKSMVQNQEKPPKGFYVTSLLQQVYRRDGLVGLYRGFGTSVLRSIPAAGATFTAYELCIRLF
ncbi:kinase-like domain-containing protein [Blakeslea trispora]|nr:kinase-like domain-containing protein [Blakeslea trispora]